MDLRLNTAKNSVNNKSAKVRIFVSFLCYLTHCLQNYLISHLILRPGLLPSRHALVGNAWVRRQPRELAGLWVFLHAGT